MKVISSDLAGVPLGLGEAQLRRSPATALPALLRALSAGTAWNDAFIAYWDMLTGGAIPISRWPPPDGRLNPIWLTDLDQLQHVVDLGSPFGDCASDLVRAVDETGGRVTYVARPGTLCDVTALRLSSHGTRLSIWRGESEDRAPTSADCVSFTASVGWERRLPREFAGALELSRRVHAMLRPGGWLVALLPSSLAILRESRRAAPLGCAARIVGTRRLLRGILRGGFSEVRSYFAAPSLQAPALLVPRDEIALRHWLGVQVDSTRLRDQMRLLLARGAFPLRVVLARR